MKLEERYHDILTQIEIQTIQVFREDPSLKDASVLKAYKAAEGYFKRRKKGLKDFHSPLPPKAEKVYTVAIAMASIALGEGDLIDEDGNPIKIKAQTNVGVMAQLFKRLGESVRFWTKRNGVRGYLNYIEGFLPKGKE